jgi:hypothetical protein
VHVTSSGGAKAASGAAATDRAEALIDVLENFFRDACVGDERLAQRLTVADTVWATHLTDADRAYTLYLDRFPIEFRREADPSAEVKVYGPTEAVIEAWTGRTFLGLQIANGVMTYDGPVRKVLRIVPMFRPLAHFGHFRDLFTRPSANNDGGSE